MANLKKKIFLSERNCHKMFPLLRIVFDSHLKVNISFEYFQLILNDEEYICLLIILTLYFDVFDASDVRLEQL